MIDSHCHLADAAFAEDLEVVVGRARAAGLTTALCILAAGDAAESLAARQLLNYWPEIRFASGVHPHQAGQFENRAREAAAVVRDALAADGACAIGEIGLDYHYDFAPRPLQTEVFAVQVDLARVLRRPIVIHTREATEDTFDVLRSAGQGEVRGVFHCFTGDRAMARDALDAGFHISLSGIATFPRADELRDVARLVPRDRLLLETDSPYLAPVPFRGRRNEPAFVVQVAGAIAGVLGVPPVELWAGVTRNFNDLFGPTPSVQTA
jgi:TatD DNase family protein